MTKEQNEKKIYFMKWLDHSMEMVESGYRFDSRPAKEVAFMAKEFYKKCANANINWENEDNAFCNSVVKLFKVTEVITGSTSEDVKLSADEIKTYEKIFALMDSLLNEVVEIYSKADGKSSKEMYDIYYGTDAKQFSEKRKAIEKIFLQNYILTIFTLEEECNIVNLIDKKWSTFRKLCGRNNISVDNIDRALNAIKYTTGSNYELFKKIFFEGTLKLVNTYKFVKSDFKIVDGNFKDDNKVYDFDEVNYDDIIYLVEDDGSVGRYHIKLEKI